MHGTLQRVSGFNKYMPARFNGRPRGFLFAGTTLVDTHIRVSDVPRPDSLVIVETPKDRMTGGLVCNNSIALKILDREIPVSASGLVGSGKDSALDTPDGDGAFILEEMKGRGIGTENIGIQQDVDTSFTWIPTVPSKKKVFIHSYGACENYGVSNLDPKMIRAGSMVMLGYLNLLPAVISDPNGQLQDFAVKVKSHDASFGVDFTDIYKPGFNELFKLAVWRSDFMITNDMSLAHGTETEVRKGNDPEAPLDAEGLLLAADKLFTMSDYPYWIAIHMPEGALFYTKDVNTLLHHALFRPSIKVEPGEIDGTTGAGDNFAAGFLAGTYYGWDVRDAMQLGNLAAVKSLGHRSATGASGTLDELRALSRQKNLNEVPSGFEGIADISEAKLG